MKHCSFLWGLCDLLFLTSFLQSGFVLHLCVAWAGTLTGAQCLDRAEGVALLLAYLGGVASERDLHLFAVLHLRWSSPLCSLSCHPHRFFLLCQSGGFAALTASLSWQGWHQRWSSSSCALLLAYALHWYWSIWHGLLVRHWYWSTLAWCSLVILWIHIFVVTLFFSGLAVCCVGSNLNGLCSIPPLDKGLSYSQLQFWSKKLPWTPSPPGWVSVYLLKRSTTCTRFTPSM